MRMRRFTSAPKPSSRVRVYRSSRSMGSLATVAVAHAVKARQVGRMPPPGDNVIGGNGEVAVGQRDLHQRGPQRLQFLQRLLDAGGAGMQPSPRIFFGRPIRRPFRLSPSPAV